MSACTHRTDCGHCLLLRSMLDDIKAELTECEENRLGGPVPVDMPSGVHGTMTEVLLSNATIWASMDAMADPVKEPRMATVCEVPPSARWITW